MRLRAFAAVVFLALSAHAGERGLPLVRSYQPEEYHAGAQNFGVAQDGKGVLYFANLRGVLAYDGAWWKLTELPNHSAVFALESDSAGRIIAGGVGELGMIEGTTFRSLRPPSMSIGDVSSICRQGDGFIAVTDRLVLAGNSRGVRVIDSTPRMHQRCFRANEEIWIAADSLLRVDGERLVTIVPKLDTDVVAAGKNKLLAVVRGVGLAAVGNGVATPLDTDASAWLKNKRATDGVRLSDGRIAVTTSEDGVAIVTADGRLDQILDQAAGVPDDVIRAAFVDREGSLWLAATGGTIVQIDLASPITVWDARLGFRGSARCLLRWNGRLYIANTHGAFAIDQERTPVRRVLSGSGSAWSMMEVEEGLLISTSNGIFLLDRDEHPTLIAGTERTGAYSMLRPTFDRSRIWFGCRTGLGALRKGEHGWQLEKMIDGAPPYVRDLAEEKGVIWTGTTFNGALRIDDAVSGKPRLTRLGNGETFLQIVDGRIAFVQEYRFVRPNGLRLVPDPRIDRLKTFGQYFRMCQDAHGDLWLNTTPPRVFRKLPAGGWAANGEPLVSIAVNDIQSITSDADGVVWLGSNRGMYRYDANARTTPVTQTQPLIRRVEAVGMVRGQTLRHDFRRLRVEFAPVSYRSGVMFQYRLDPIDTEWNPWSAETCIDFTSLRGGDYTFRVRARGPEGSISADTRWTFTVLRPWYMTKTAYALFAVGLAAMVILIVRIRTATLRGQAERLRARIAERTQELHEKNELLVQANARLERLSLFDELTGIANRRYFQRLLNQDWLNAIRDRGSLALIMVDLDHFKELNDTRGHLAGDDCLRRVGEFLGTTIRRSGDVAARYGGEEFAVLLVGAGESDARQIAERLRVGVAQLQIPYDESGTRTLTASCGVASIAPSTRTAPDMLIEEADQALYAAKNAGRDCVRAASEIAPPAVSARAER